MKWLCFIAGCALTSIASAARASPEPGSIELHRAWLLRGGSGIDPADGAEVIAIDFTHHMEHVHARVADLKGMAFDSSYNWVKLDERGDPIDRMGGAHGHGSVRVAMVSAVPRGTRKVLLQIDGLDPLPVRIAESGPEWPPMPEYTVLKWGRNLAGNAVFVLVRVRNVLLDEPRSPVLQEKIKRGNAVAIQQQATSVVGADGHGEPLADSRTEFYVAYYPWKERLPTEYSCASGWCPLGKPSQWRMSDALFEALSGRALDR